MWWKFLVPKPLQPLWWKPLSATHNTLSECVQASVISGVTTYLADKREPYLFYPNLSDFCLQSTETLYLFTPVKVTQIRRFEKFTSRANKQRHRADFVTKTLKHWMMRQTPTCWQSNFMNGGVRIYILGGQSEVDRQRVREKERERAVRRSDWIHEMKTFQSLLNCRAVTALTQVCVCESVHVHSFQTSPYSIKRFTNFCILQPPSRCFVY